LLQARARSVSLLQTSQEQEKVQATPLSFGSLTSRREPSSSRAVSEHQRDANEWTIVDER
jgi:hypothetical protein